MYKQSLLSASIVLALSSTSAFADDYALFDEVVVSSTRTNQQLEDVAASVTVINDKDIEKNMVTDVNDLFKYTPGVTVTTNSRQGIQGINIRGMEGNRVKVIVDGVSQTSQFTPSGTQSYNFINSSRVDIDTDMLKSVEIVKGAASSLYGSDAIGGIAAFETKDPSDFLKGKDFGGHAKFNYSSSDNTFSESVALANRIGDLETLVAYTRRDGEQTENFGTPNEQDTQNNNLLVKLQYQFNEQHRLEFSGNFIENSGDTDLNSSSYTGYTGEDSTSQQQIGIKHIWDANLAFADTVTWQADWLSKEENGVTNRTSNGGSMFLPPAGNVQKKDYIYEDKGYQLDVQFDKFFMTGNVENYFIYGASYSDKDIKNVNNEYNSISADQVIFYIPSASERKYGFFAQNEMTIGNWMITPGVRFDGFETDPGDTSQNPSGNPEEAYAKYSDSAVTGRLGTTYTLNDENKIFGQISQGFRAPDFQELYYSFGNPAHGYVNAPNPDLEAEESISYELGWRHNTNYSSSEIAIFYSDYDNFIDTQPVSGSGSPMDPTVYKNINIDEAVIKGIEASNTLSWNSFMPVQGVSTRVAATYTEGEDGEGNPLNSVNPWNAVVGFNYDAPSALWGTSLNISYTAGKKSSDINSAGLKDEILPTDSATVVDLTAYYLPMKDLTLRAGLFNVTDEEYYSWNDVRGFSQEDKDYTQAGRNWSITAKYEF
ncbi:TonB-dependent hemoglobin/transferrin/lactoferrin family receptor [Vibrio splendidus]|uniref:TonB-dependent hemoglobin/transferrin/lactoferrin family receptor n=1 Tax=Vibrio splendidus TaxID=29497 RepID=UPI00148B3A55|nr:TonB-dependent hemoglobin/transferrin/lactoferrin family receptor [Vibrio splendidus]NOJ02140.1 TonB-dependent hemoglobin/transferrin/lactoferrin family receptor [Vibrio splendidus]